MSLDAKLWEQLEHHGVCQEHLELLLRLLSLQKNGSWAWHFQHGAIGHCDLRVTFGSRQAEVARVSEALLDGDGVVR